MVMADNSPFNEQPPPGGNWQMQEIYNLYRSRGYSHDEATAQVRDTMPPTGAAMTGNFTNWNSLGSFLNSLKWPQGPGSAQ